MPSGVEAGQAELCHISAKYIFPGMEWGCGASAWARGCAERALGREHSGTVAA